MLFQNTPWLKWKFLITDTYQETWILKLSFGIVWLAFLPRAQEVKIAYISPEIEQFDKVESYTPTNALSIQ